MGRFRRIPFRTTFALAWASIAMIEFGECASMAPGAPSPESLREAGPPLDGISAGKHGIFAAVLRSSLGNHANDSELLPVSLPTSLSHRAADTDVGWGLAYLSEKEQNPPDQTYHYLEDSGKGVDIYIIDSGINPIQPLEGRVINEKDYTGRGYPDTFNHGTTVASFAASKKYGSAKKATLRSYKVDKENGDANEEWVYTAINDIVDVVKIRQKDPNYPYRGSVINISVEIPDNFDIEVPLDRAESAGITVVVAAGNDYTSADRIRPCSYDNVICVGAIKKGYGRSEFSNYGKKLTLFAPGEGLNGYDKDGNERGDLEGTSFACPYVAGIVATYYGYEGTNMNPARAKALLKQNAEISILTGIKSGSPNVLANNGYQKAQPDLPYLGAPANPQPASATSSAAPSSSVPSSSPTTPSLPPGDCSALLTETISGTTIAFEGAFGYSTGAVAGHGHVETNWSRQVDFPTDFAVPVSLTPYTPASGNGGVTFKHGGFTWDSSDPKCNVTGPPASRIIACYWDCHAS